MLKVKEHIIYYTAYLYMYLFFFRIINVKENTLHEG